MSEDYFKAHWSFAADELMLTAPYANCLGNFGALENRRQALNLDQRQRYAILGLKYDNIGLVIASSKN